MTHDPSRNGDPRITATHAAERSVLGAMLIDARCVRDVDLSAADFDRPAHSRIFRAILAAHADDGLTDPVAVASHLGPTDGAGFDDLLDLMAGVVSTVSVPYHVGIIREAARGRRIAELGRRIVSHVERGDIDAMLEARHQLDELVERGPKRTLSVMTLAELLALEPPSWILDGLVPETGLVLLAGDPKTGKSLLAQDWTMRMVHGLDRWHRRRLVPGSVLYLAGEGLPSMRARAAAWLAAHPEERLCHPLAVARLPLLSTPTGLAEVDATIAEHQPALVVVDTLNLALGDLDENDASEVGPVMSALSRIRDERGCTILLVHHLNKGDPARSLLARVRGSGAIAGAMDAILGLTKDSDGAIEIETVMRDAESGPVEDIRLRFALIALEDGTSGVHFVSTAPTVRVTPTPEEQAEAQQRREEAARIARHEAAEKRVAEAVQALRDLGGKSSSREAIASRVGGKLTRARAAVVTAIDRGLIVTEGKGRSQTYHLGKTAESVHVPDVP